MKHAYDIVVLRNTDFKVPLSGKSYAGEELFVRQFSKSEVIMNDTRRRAVIARLEAAVAVAHHARLNPLPGVGGWARKKFGIDEQDLLFTHFNQTNAAPPA